MARLSTGDQDETLRLPTDAMSLYASLAGRFARARLPRPWREGVLPMKITVASTFQCNHQCRICNVWCVYRSAPEKLKEELKPDDYRRIFQDLRDGLLFMDWGGGEPFLREDMVEILLAAAEICPHLSSIVITTNGLLSNRIASYVGELAARLPRHLLSIGVSLDGDEATHDDIRGVRGAFRAACETVRKLREIAGARRNLEVKVSYTLCSLNAGRLAEFCGTALAPLGLSVGDIAFNLEHVGNLFQTPATGRATVGEVAAERVRAGISADIAFALDRIRAERLPLLKRLKGCYRTFFLDSIPGYLDRPDKMVIPCMAARNSLYLDPYGSYYPCVVWDRRIAHHAEGYRKIMASGPMAEVRSIIDRGACPVCWNACEAIPSLLTSWRLAGCVARGLMGG